MATYLAGITSPAGLVFIAATMAGISGLPGLFPGRLRCIGQKLATILLGSGSLLGLGGSLTIILNETTESFALDWGLPFGPCELAIDPLAALFLIPVFLVSACCALYANGYWPAAAHRSTEPGLTFFFGLLTSAMAFLLTIRNGAFFLMVWEIMALAAYFLLAVEHEQQAVRRSGTVYLVATHTGTLALFVMFGILRSSSGSFVFPTAASLDGSLPLAAAIFLAALVGFGSKAGLMPFHLWLPGAHANAPSHVSAIMSGVMLKMGIYGIIRTVSLFHSPPLWWGGVLLAIGLVSGLAGIAFAAAQRDMKRLLAYSSIENIGIISCGVGLALIGQTTGSRSLVLLGMGGALLHLLNHSLFKPILFLGAGAVIHATGTRQIDLMGGLARRMPSTALCFLVGAAAISGLPPLNGFVGEYLLYLGLFGDATSSTLPFLPLAIPTLALIGSLALLCFVKLAGTAFLGLPRTPKAEEAHEAGPTIIAPLALLSLLCAGIGIFPGAAVRLVEPAIYAWSPSLVASGSGLALLVPTGWLTTAALILAAVAACLFFALRMRLCASPTASSGTWDCGYARPTPRMQYTGTAFADLAVSLYGRAMGSLTESTPLRGYFPSAAAVRGTLPELLLERVIQPTFRLFNLLFSLVRKLQHGEPQLYVLYMVVTLILLMAWAR